MLRQQQLNHSGEGCCQPHDRLQGESSSTQPTLIEMLLRNTGHLLSSVLSVSLCSELCLYFLTVLHRVIFFFMVSPLKVYFFSCHCSPILSPFILSLFYVISNTRFFFSPFSRFIPCFYFTLPKNIPAFRVMDCDLGEDKE